ncbi:UNVERIFIED_CONTAM: hypothetical protein Sindi_2349400, partial [Sesamum indicum]
MGREWFRNNFNRGGGRPENPTLRMAHRAVQTVTGPRRTGREHPRGGEGVFCDGPHMYRGLPEETGVECIGNDLSDNASSSKSVEPQAEAGGENDTEEYEDNLGPVAPPLAKRPSRRCGAAGKTVPALTVEQPEQKEEEVQPRIPRKKGLMFVDVKIHGKPIRAMIDTGASHNYLASAEVARLGLVLEKGVGACEGDQLGCTTHCRCSQ